MEQDFEHLYRTYYMQVYSFVMSLAKNQHTAEEITQKAFFKAMAGLKDWRGDSSEFTWLCTIARNLFMDECRRQKKTCELSTEGISENCIESKLADEEAAFGIHQVLHNLEEPYKEVFQLRVFGELPFEKIGKLFGKTENWARVTYHRARLKVQERMEKV